MAALAMRNFNLSLDMVSSLDLARLEEFRRTEDELDWLNNEIVAFVVVCPEGADSAKRTISSFPGLSVP